ncbi:aminodeoxychorismate lyase [Rhodococcoides fascians]|uniref:endolytic transglycosylase MltG n=1 Tax=Rhodococcoides fascians TaxID=1828 RepID=UPI000B9C456F|nr:endolytic transglycosylase MltG [Rhodococcus fascians]OZE85486.1 aminodeoxychorismate lyase [Rhodococcus fascians]OZF11993.1 aminodeoxychorismate lyase [Rhodococcus fascians]OZF14762.1 aminodeoxychorismate lyase [Rhodococcus fascians]OZF61340.1 aminodeoxychorismate lyase [Rhodococcus fascians]OZF64445.1 aminodeoxychorismate lyase [Rhodococcus fascians]
MSNHGSDDRGRRRVAPDEAHTDPIGYRVDEGSEFHRSMNRSRPPQRSEPHTQGTRRADREAGGGPAVDPDAGAMPQAVGRSRAAGRRERTASSRKRRGRVVALVLGLLLIVAVAGGGYFAVNKFGNRTTPNEDFAAGSSGDGVVIQVHPNDTAQQIGTEAADKGVVASSGAFLEAALQNNAITSVQPGFYLLTSGVPASRAVEELVDPASRVGNMVISEGRQLHDARDVNTGSVKKGIYTLISEASCVDRTGSGSPTCISYDDLNAAGAVDDPAALGVPQWATDRVEGVPDRDRQLEGLIAAGTWDFDPSAAPADILKQLVSESATRYEDTGILTAGSNSGLTPYDTLVAASLVERESLPQDFSKVARVILNRLAVPQKLEFDSTVNYSLDTTEVATTDADRATVTPWNTYASEGLPATPISSPSIGAVQAVEMPADGDWLYFVTINQAGETLFTRSYDEHLANIGKVEAGFLDSGR